MTPADAAVLIKLLSVDAQYLAESMELARPDPARPSVMLVTIPLESAKVLQHNYQLTIASLAGTSAKPTEPINHPQTRVVTQFTQAREKAEQQMQEANQLSLDAIKGLPQNLPLS